MQRRTVAENRIRVDLFVLTRPFASLRCGLALCADVNHAARLRIVMQATAVVCDFNLPIQD